MRISAVAGIAGVSTRAVRHYHHVGLLPEPRRTQNGYRDYQLGDVVRLLRIRRLVELGLSLDEVADAIADDSGRELAEILAELDAELAAAQDRLQRQRDRIAEVAATGGNVDSAQLDALTAGVEAILGAEHPSLPREHDTFRVLEAIAPAAELERVADVLGRIGANPELRATWESLSRRFEDLADRSPHDPAVDEVAAAAASVGAELVGLLTESPGAVERDGGAGQLLLAAVDSELAPAQARCLSLMAARWAARS